VKIDLKISANGPTDFLKLAPEHRSAELSLLIVLGVQH
jgi:hypothetical protein